MLVEFKDCQTNKKLKRIRAKGEQKKNTKKRDEKTNHL